MVGFAFREIKGPGPCHTIVKPGVGVKPELKLSGLHTHTGPLDVTFNCGEGLTTTVVEPEQVAAPVAVTVYIPAFNTWAPGTVTDCPVAVYPFGPVQA